MTGKVRRVGSVREKGLWSTGQFGGGGSRFDPGRQLVTLEVSDYVPFAVPGGEESVEGGVLGAGAFGEPVPCRPGRRSWLHLFLRFLRLG
ncbi:hypothetical protein GCM10020000_82900 [Streptomyces olivoverticillatus]